MCLSIFIHAFEVLRNFFDFGFFARLLIFFFCAAAEPNAAAVAAAAAAEGVAEGTPIRQAPPTIDGGCQADSTLPFSVLTPSDVSSTCLPY